MSPSADRWWRNPEFCGLVLLVAGIYFTRIGAMPVVGEETRWGRGAVQMLETGDWIVPRQQGQVFPERPPLNSWTMALVGMARGEVDAFALRLPSVIAILLTCVVIYAYASAFLSRTGALAAATAYATFAQVLQIGRHGESEPLFTMFLSSALLVWHAGFRNAWRPAAMWVAGYALAGLAALVKGPQAPVYFVVVTGAYLLLRRRARMLLGWPHALGLATMLAVVGAWQIPFYRAAGWEHTVAIWSGLAGDRFSLRGLLGHVAGYPFETAGALLPWSLLLLAWGRRGFRRAVGEMRSELGFLLTAIAVTYPTVWLAAGARSRYYMPLYPLLAVLVGIVVDRSVAAPADSRNRYWWRVFLRGVAWTVAAAGVAIVAISVWPKDIRFQQSVPFALVFLLAAVGTAAVLLWARRDAGAVRTRIALLVLGGFLGLSYTGVATNHYRRYWNDPAPAVAAIRRQLPDPERLVSLGPVDHRFCYHYRTTIRQLPWPDERSDLPAGVEYFCMDFFPAATHTRGLGRGRSWREVPNRLPFEWELIAKLSCERRPRPDSRHVVVGRVVRR